MRDQIVTVRSKKYDLSIRRSWKCRFLNRNDSLLTLVGEFDQDIEHGDLGIIKRGTISYEYYWLDRWYNVFRFHEPNGDLRNFYCNVNMPPEFDGSFLDYIDLDIDILVWPNFDYSVLDREEFEQNAKLYGYPEAILEKAEESIDDLKILIDKRKFPFNSEDRLM